MSENFLSFNSVSYTLPNGEKLLEDISFSIGNGEKAALIGANGSGKTTLFRLAAKEFLPGSGAIHHSEPPVFLPQQIDLTQNIGQALGVMDILNALEEIEKGNGTEELFDLVGQNWNIRAETQEALKDFGLEGFELTHSFASLSGGEREKILLLRVFLSAGNILMFDEPTNNLDEQSRSVFYDYIEKTPKTVLVISHDRELLERMNCLYELKGGTLNRYGGNYEFYQTAKANERSRLEEQKSHLENETQRLSDNRKTIEEGAGKQKRFGEKKVENRKFPKIKANSMKSAAQETKAKKIRKIEEQLDRHSTELNDVKLSLKDEQIKIPVPEKPFLKDKVLELSDVSFGFEQKKLFSHLNLILKGGDRLQIQGANGSGKTTLLRLILGELSPSEGRVSLFGKAAYLSQSLSLPLENKSILDNILALNPDISINEAYAAAANFLFRNKDALKTVSELSGGERLKACLAALLGTRHQPDLLILDEPTNNLDIRSTEILEQALKLYQGAVILISHDRIFVQNTGNKNVLHLPLKSADGNI